MQFDIDLNDFSGGPNWLSPAGRIDRAAIREKHRANHRADLSTRERVKKPASPETRARLEAALEDHKTAGAAKIVATFNQAINVVDHTEATVRNMIENDLMDIAGINGTKVKGTVAAGKALAQKIAVVRANAIKRAFRHLRANLPGHVNIFGRSLATWASTLTTHDAMMIESAISIGLTSGDDNTDIAHRVIGSRRLNGSNGATEITRQHIIRLGRGYLRKRKSRMSGASTDDPAK
jgi:hypothetical protein